MPNKITLMLLLILALLAYYFFNEINNKPPNNINKSNNEQKILAKKTIKRPKHRQTPVEDETQYEEDNNNTIDDDEIEEQEPDDEILALMIQRQQYSTDPTIEILSTMLEYQSCKDISYRFDNIKENSLKKQLQEKVLKQCQFVRENHDILNPYRSDRKVKEFLQNKLFDSPSKTEFLHLFDITDKTQAKEGMFNFILKSKSAQLLSIIKKASRVPTFYHAIKNQLGISNEPYINMISNEAIHMFACQYQNGMTCTNTSAFMMDKCKNEQVLCGKDSEYWFDHYIYSGHKAEIQKVMELMQTWHLK